MLSGRVGGLHGVAVAAVGALAAPDERETRIRPDSAGNLPVMGGRTSDPAHLAVAHGSLGKIALKTAAWH
jgi:hypothetical protein